MVEQLLVKLLLPVVGKGVRYEQLGPARMSRDSIVCRRKECAAIQLVDGGYEESALKKRKEV